MLRMKKKRRRIVCINDEKDSSSFSLILFNIVQRRSSDPNVDV